MNIFIKTNKLKTFLFFNNTTLMKLIILLFSIVYLEK